MIEARRSIKSRLSQRCLSVNIAKFLRTAFSIDYLWRLLLELRLFFLICDTFNFKIYEGSMTQHNLMISSSVGSGHPGKYWYEIPMNT